MDLRIVCLAYFIACVTSHSETIRNEEECKIADLCVHDKVPMCAIDSCGEMRTFIDTCDMHEFNCDSKKDFKQRPIHECWVTCKRGRSFKKPEYRTDCNLLQECKMADICRHDQVPLCGIDSCGEMRTFIDSCDLHEFNCDSKKDFIQKPVHECWVTCKRGRSFKKPLYRTDCGP
ncbi:unnamed protein product [Plutella xylostella]|uniref:(diamondback moth) hypothetical protein n=1 Tax=Plutella xylostella TaxID=51655 RepID=A0A8S4EAS7_PLUXY|nr:unnamed protein product [Plutella xylostella]